PLTLAEQAQHSLRQLVGLGQDGGAGLLQDLVLGQFRGFGSEVGVANPATSGRGVLSDVLQVRDGVLEAVLHGTELGALAVDVGDRAVDDAQGVLCSRRGADVDGVDRIQLTEAVGTQATGQAVNGEGIGSFQLDLTVGASAATFDDVSGITDIVLAVKALGPQSRTARTGVVGDLDGIAAGADQLDGAALGYGRDAGLAGFTVDGVGQGREVGGVGDHCGNGRSVGFLRLAGQAGQVE